MTQPEWYPTGYARQLIILNEKGAKDSAPKAASVKFTKSIMTEPKSAYAKVPNKKAVKAPKAKDVKAPKAKAVKAPKTEKIAMSNIPEPEE